jgi:hypothetical protein
MRTKYATKKYGILKFFLVLQLRGLQLRAVKTLLPMILGRGGGGMELVRKFSNQSISQL